MHTYVYLFMAYLTVNIVPSFKNAQKSTTFHCYLYGSPQEVNIGDTVIMRPIVTGSNLTLIWTKTFNGETKVIDKNNKDFFVNNMVRTACIVYFVCTYVIEYMH